MTTYKVILLAGAALLGAMVAARADDDRGAQGVRHVLLISVDGMHEVDLRLWVQNHPTGALAKLSQRGTTYRNAYTTLPSDSFPGMIAQFTGGTPKSTGVYYDDSFSRTLYSNPTCTTGPGVEVMYAENIDVDQSRLDAGGILGQPLTQIDPNKLPGRKLANGTCKPVFPHGFIRVNTLFEVLRSHDRHTAWSDKHAAYEILNGPSGQGIEDLYTPEINSQAPNLPAGDDNTMSFLATRNYDATKVAAVINEIDGLKSTGQHNGYTPAIYGMNFQAVSVGQKLTVSLDTVKESGLMGGYTDAAGTPGVALTQQLQFVDDSVGKMVNELKLKDQYENTVIIISAKHGQSPIDPSLLQRIPDTFSAVLAQDSYAFNNADDAALIWLNPAQRTPAIYAKALSDLQAAKTKLGIDYIIARDKLTEIFQDPFKDNRVPDFLVVTKHGVVYTGKKAKIAEHGGNADDDRHVAMLVSAPGLNGNSIGQTVFTTQIAPTILSAFRISPAELQAVREEDTKILPGLGRGEGGDDR